MSDHPELKPKLEDLEDSFFGEEAPHVRVSGSKSNHKGSKTNDRQTLVEEKAPWSVDEGPGAACPQDQALGKRRRPAAPGQGEARADTGPRYLINVRFGPLCGLRSDLTRGPRRANALNRCAIACGAGRLI